MGNYDSILEQNKDAIGTIWNAWQTQWSGVINTEYGEKFTDFSTERGFGRGGKLADVKQRVVQTTRTELTRTGLHTEVVENIEEESSGKRIIARALIPFIRPRTITVTGNCFRPGIRLYAFFDGKNMSNFITPASSEFSNVDSPIEGDPLITNGAGNVECAFRIPENNFAGQEGVPKFKTGEVEFRLTSSSTNNKSVLPLTAGQTTYKSVGILETEQETITSTKNAEVIETELTDSDTRDVPTTYNRIVGTTVTKEEEKIIPRAPINVTQQQAQDNRDEERARNTVTLSTQDFANSTKLNEVISRNPGANISTVNINKMCGSDPLAQTFLCTTKGGAFITKVDLYFAAKDNLLPVWVELRNVVNGYPGKKLLPFGRSVKQAQDVNVDATTGTSATTFTFDSPVYVQEGQEYCFVTMTNSLEYKIWISQMGEADVSGSNRLISSQPTLGSLFKSQNNRTWNAIQSQDKKFTLYQAVFDVGEVGTVSLTNDNISTEKTNEEGQEVYAQRLLANPLVMTNGSTVLKIRHRDHGMYSTSNNVTITGASSNISTTLNADITTSSTSLTLASSTNFPSSGTVTLKLFATASRGGAISNQEIISGTISGTTVSSLTRGIGDSDAQAHLSSNTTVELYQINGVPLTEINATHTAIDNIGIDSYTINLSSTPSVSGASGDAEVGGINVFASENYRFEIMQTAISALELTDARVLPKLRTTSATSPNGTETSFSTVTAAKAVGIPLGENVSFDTSKMVASKINETNELSSEK